MKKHNYYHTCHHCGANLDPGEQCDCLVKKQQLQDRCVCCHTFVPEGRQVCGICVMLASVKEE